MQRVATDVDTDSSPTTLRQMVAGLLEELDSKECRLQQLQHMVEQLLRALRAEA